MPSRDYGHCPGCGAALAGDAPAPALCPRCLYRLGLQAAHILRDGSPVEDSASSETELMLARTLLVHPERIGPYRILQPLKEGGMGIVYLAEQQQPIRRRVALKLIKLGMDSREVVARFESERQALAMMDHPNIARVFDAGATADGRPYFVMEYVAGQRITQYCDEHRLSNQERVGLFVQVCAAVQHAHQKGVIHRDLKPSNVLVTVQDGRPVPKVIDFGVAKAMNQPLTERTLFTQHGRIVGTLEYMSPEQAEGAVDIDATTDIYSLGVLLYELLVGTLPFDASALRRAGYAEMQRVIREEEPARPSTRLSGLGDTAREVARLRATDLSSLERDLRGDLDWITMKAMEKERGRRYSSASEFGSDLARHLNDEPVVARPPSTPYRVGKFVHRHKVAVAAGVAVVSALAIGLAISTMSYSRAESARRALQDQSYVASLSAAALHLRSHEVLEAKRMLAVARPDIRGWEWRHLYAKSDASLRMLSSGGGAPLALGTTPDGRSLFWLSEVGVLRFADATTLVQQPGLTSPNVTRPDDGPPEYIVGMSPDGTRYASVAWVPFLVMGGTRATVTNATLLHGPLSDGEENTITVKETATRRVLARLRSPLGSFRTLSGPRDLEALARRGWAGRMAATAAFSKDARYLATWTLFGRVLTVHDLADGRLVAELDGHESGITSASFSHDGAHLVSSSYDRTIRLWNLRTRAVQHVLNGHEGAVWTVVFSPDGRLIASGGADGVVRVWDLSGTRTATFHGHTSGIEAIAFAPDGTRLVSGSADQSIRVWRTGVTSPPDVLLGHSKAVTSLAFSPDGSRIISGGADHTLRVWGSVGANIPVVGVVEPWVHPGVAMSPDGRRVAIAGSDGLTRVWDRELSQAVTTVEGHGRSTGALAFTHDGARLVSIGNGEARVWDPATGALFSRRVTPRRFFAPSLLPDGTHVVDVEEDGAVRVWNLEAGEPSVTLSPGAKQPRSSFSAKVAKWKSERLGVGNQRQIGVWDLVRRTKLLTVEAIDSPLTALAFDPDGARLGSGHQDGTIRIWDIGSAQVVHRFMAHDAPVRWIAFNPIGGRIVSASDDRLVRIWSAEPRQQLTAGVQRPGARVGEPLLTLDHGSPVHGIGITSNGATIATWDRSVVRFWSSESWYSVEPRMTIDLLRGSGLTSLDAISQLNADASMEPALRRDALQYAAAQGDQPGALSEAAWSIVSAPGNTPDAYTRAVALAEADWRAAPWVGRSLTTLAAAYYRTGRYTDALDSLRAAARLNVGIGPGREFRYDLEGLAFSAMAHKRLGRDEEARLAVEQLEKLMKGARSSAERVALAAEAASVVRGPHRQPE